MKMAEMDADVQLCYVIMYWNDHRPSLVSMYCTIKRMIEAEDDGCIMEFWELCNPLIWKFRRQVSHKLFFRFLTVSKNLKCVVLNWPSYLSQICLIEFPLMCIQELYHSSNINTVVFDSSEFMYDFNLWISKCHWDPRLSLTHFLQDSLSVYYCVL